MSARSWILTINNPQEDFNVDVPNLRYAIWQLECGDGGTYHFQAYAEFDATKRLSAIKAAWPTCHAEPRKGTKAQAMSYCSKEATRIAGPWIHGEPSTQGKRNDIEEFRNSIRRGLSDIQLFDEHATEMAKFPNFASTYRRAIASAAAEPVTILHPSAWQEAALALLTPPPSVRKIHWFYDRDGNNGKTHLCQHILTNHDAFYTMGGKFNDIAFAYQGQPIVLFDYPRCSEEFVSYAALEALKNGIITVSKYASQTFRFKQPHVLIFANFMPDRSKLSNDRWDVHIIHNNLPRAQEATIVLSDSD